MKILFAVIPMFLPLQVKLNPIKKNLIFLYHALDFIDEEGYTLSHVAKH